MIGGDLVGKIQRLEDILLSQGANHLGRVILVATPGKERPGQRVGADYSVTTADLVSSAGPGTVRFGIRLRGSR
jgi:hypothetical protein